MRNLNAFDISAMCVYFLILIGLGLYLRKKASASMEDYFLGGRKMPWWALGISGIASWLDIAGTMIITSFLFMLGPRGLYIEIRGGIFALAFFMIFLAKWHRRSGCITGAEWMVYRFGKGFGGQFARIVNSVAIVVFTIGMLAYLIKGVGLFLSMFLPYSPLACSIALLIVATLYTAMSGFYGVVVTDIFQSGIILFAVVVVSVLAILKVNNSPESLAAVAYQVTGNENWTSSACSWVTHMPKGYEVYNNLGMFVMFYIVRGILVYLGSGADPKYFGAKSDRDCGLMNFLWGWLLMLRWPLMMGIAILGLFLVKDVFPDQSVLLESTEVIKLEIGQVEESRWPDVVAEIINHPENYSTGLIEKLQHTLGDNWANKLQLVGYKGTVNPERVLPAVLLMCIPMGLRGFILIALIAACMSTFDTNVNIGTAYFTNDLYKQYLRPKAKTKELVAVSWFFIVVMVIAGFLFAYTIRSINDIWAWLMMGLSGGIMVSAVLRMYWWRFNGSGFVVSTIAGVSGAIIQRILFPDLDPRMQFVSLFLIGLTGAIIGTYLTGPTDSKVLEHFYKTTRPFGLWGPFKKVLSPEVRKAMEREHRNDIMALPFGMVWLITLFFLPMQLMVRDFQAFGITSAIFVISLIGLYKFWYTKLPPACEKTQKENQC